MKKDWKRITEAWHTAEAAMMIGEEFPEIGEENKRFFCYVYRARQGIARLKARMYDTKSNKKVLAKIFLRALRCILSPRPQI